MIIDSVRFHFALQFDWIENSFGLRFLSPKSFRLFSELAMQLSWRILQQKMELSWFYKKYPIIWIFKFSYFLYE